MPTIQTVCPQCQATYQVPDTIVGKKARCKQCQASFTVATLPDEEEQGFVEVVEDAASAEEEIVPTVEVVVEERAAIQEKPAPRPANSRVQPAAAQPSPAAARPAAAKAAPKVDEDEDEDEGPRRLRPKKASGSSGMLVPLAIAGGSLFLLLFLGCGGIGVYWLLSGNPRVNAENFEQLKLGMPLAEVETLLGRGNPPSEAELSPNARSAATMFKVREWRRWSNGKKVIVAGFSNSSDTLKASVLSYEETVNVGGFESTTAQFKSGTADTAVAIGPGPGQPNPNPISNPGTNPRVTFPPIVTNPNDKPRQEFKPTVATDEDVAKNLAEFKEGSPPRRRDAANRFAATPSPDVAKRGEAAHALEGLLNDPDGGVRQAAAKALIIWATEAEVPGLIKAAENTDNNVRGSAMEALARLKDPRGAPVIASRLANAFENETASRLLTLMGPVAEPAVLAYLHHPDGGARERVRKLCKVYETKDVALIDRTLVDLKDIDVNRRALAVRWLAELPPNEERRKETAAALAPLVKDASNNVREPAIKALGVWATKDQSTVLMDLVGDTNGTNRHLAIEALGRLGDDKAADKVAARLVDGGDRQHAAIALKSMGPGAEAAVFTYLGHNDAAVRIEACRIMEVVGTTRKCLEGLRFVATRDRNREVVAAATSAGKAVNERLKKP